MKETLTGSGHGSTVDYFWKRTQKSRRDHQERLRPHPLQLAQEMETLGSMLDLNKREIITMALIDFLTRHGTR